MSAQAQRAASPKPEADPDLATVISAWPRVSAELRAGITAMIKSALAR
jgi:hypothetical protein